MSKSNDRGLFERPKGSGVWWILYYDGQGQRHREKIGTKSAARAAYQKRKAAILEHRFFPEQVGRRQRVTLQQAIDNYLLSSASKRNHGHHQRYAGYWAAFLPKQALDDLKPQDVERYRRERLQSVSESTINREVAFLRAAYNLAIRDGLTERNPVSRVKPFRENNKRVRFLTEEEEAGLEAAMTAEHFTLVEFAIQTGLRQEEQFKLRWETVDLANAVLTVPRSKHGEKRHVPLNDIALELLRGLPSRLRSEWVFPSKTGLTPLNAQNFYHRAFVPALERAGIQDFVWHDLRHTFASRLVMEGVDLRTVQELLGHKSIQMTERYAHLAPSHLKSAVNALVRRKGAKGASRGTAGGVTATKTATEGPRKQKLSSTKKAR